MFFLNQENAQILSQRTGVNVKDTDFVILHACLIAQNFFYLTIQSSDELYIYIYIYI